MLPMLTSAVDKRFMPALLSAGFSAVDVFRKREDKRELSVFES